MTISEKPSLEAASQTEGILETPKALLEASQQVIELETMLSKKAEEHAELREKFCTVEEELARIRERTQESVHELEMERQEKDELLERLRNLEERKVGGGQEDPHHPPQRPEAEREDGDGASVADEPVGLQQCHGKQTDCTGLSVYRYVDSYTAQTLYSNVPMIRTPVCWRGCLLFGLDGPASLASPSPFIPSPCCSSSPLLSVWIWCRGALG